MSLDAILGVKFPNVGDEWIRQNYTYMKKIVGGNEKPISLICKGAFLINFASYKVVMAVFPQCNMYYFFTSIRDSIFEEILPKHLWTKRLAIGRFRLRCIFKKRGVVFLKGKVIRLDALFPFYFLSAVFLAVMQTCKNGIFLLRACNVFLYLKISVWLVLFFMKVLYPFMFLFWSV